jgi:hypothetical protein
MDYYGSLYELEQTVDYGIEEIKDEFETETTLDKIGSIPLKELLKAVFMIHLTIILLILAAYYENKNSIHYPITRLQLAVVISSFWFFLYCYC